MSVQSNPFMRKIYNLSPPPFQSAAVSILGLNIRYNRYNDRFHELTDDYRRHQWNDAEYWQQYQLEKLTEIAKYAKRTTDHYRSIDVKPIQSAETPKEALKHLPYLESDTIRNKPHSLISAEVNTDNCISLSTSGTTGTPKTTY